MAQMKGSKARPERKPGQRAKKMLLEHPHDTLRQIAIAADCSPRIASYQKKRLIETGAVPPGYFTQTALARTNSTSKGAPTGSALPEKPHEPLKFDGKNLSTEESLEMLTKLARDGYEVGNYAQAKGSIETHDKLQTRSAVSTLGPPDPQTDPEKVDRLAILLDVCGPILAASAILKAFWEAPERTLFLGEVVRQQATRTLDINPWAKTGTISPPPTIEEAADGESSEGPSSTEMESGDAETPPDNEENIHLGEDAG